MIELLSLIIEHIGMDSGNESEPSSIKLRNYAKKAIAGRLKMQDGSWKDVPATDEVNSRILKVAKQLDIIEMSVGARTISPLRKV